MAPLTLVALTEEWIMNKVGLNHQRLGDVRSLSLPGTYKQKIGYLGNGLANFERLKSLNLSHNSLVSLEGLQHLKHLQILNLYYNCIPSLEEVKVLFELSFLRELDLRLNPLGKIYPHYRPFVVLAMASLRKLDGCPVKDAERKAAKKRCSRLRSRDDRQALVERLSMKLSLLSDEDDVGSNPVDIRRSHSYSNEELQSAPDHQCPSPSHSGSSPFFNRSWLTKPGLRAENKQQDSYRKPLEELLDVMDKHWVGKRTLQLNTNFLTQIVQILSMMENHISSKDAEVKTLKEEVGALCFFAAAQEREHKADVTEFTARLGELNTQLRVALEKNAALQKELITSERLYRQCMADHLPALQDIGAQRRVEELRKEVAELRRKVKEAQERQGPTSVLTGSAQECD